MTFLGGAIPIWGVMAAVGCGAHATDPIETQTAWPKQATLHAMSPASGDSFRLADGVVVTGDSDLRLRQSMVISLASAVANSVCEKGKVASLAEVPNDQSTCPGSPGGTWSGSFPLGGSSVHTLEQSYVIGRSALVFDASHQAIYRLRILGDSYDEHGFTTAMFEYEPVR